MVEPIQKDYGKDLRVEVFHESSNSSDAESTGIEFYIQSKSTNKPQNKGTFTFDIKIKHLEYWDSHILPVLLVRYHAPTRKLYSRWTYTIPIKHGQKTQKIEINPIPWDDTIKDKLYSDLSFLRSLQQGSLSFPLSINIDDSESFKQLKHYWQDEPLLDATVLSPTWPRLTKFEDCIVVDFGITSIWLKSESIDICRDITAAIAVILIRHSYSGQGARLLESSLDWSALSPNMVFSFSSNLPMMCNRLMLDGRNDIIAQILYGILACAACDTGMAETVAEHLFIACCDDDLDMLDNLLRRQPSLSRSSWLCVVLSECYLKLGYGDRATHALTSAMQRDAQLVDDPRYLRVAGLTAGTQNKIGEAITQLERADQFGDLLASRYISPMLVDHGRYQDAFDHLVQLDNLSDTEEGDRLLLKLALEHLIGVTGISDQVRDTERAMHASSQLADPSLSIDECEAILAEAFKADAAWGSVWFNRGVVRDNHNLNSFMDYLSAAVFCPNDLTTWAFTIVCSLGMCELLDRSKASVELVNYMVSAATRVNGQDMIKQLQLLATVDNGKGIRSLQFDELTLVAEPKFNPMDLLEPYLANIPTSRGLLEIWRPSMGAREGKNVKSA